MERCRKQSGPTSSLHTATEMEGYEEDKNTLLGSKGGCWEGGVLRWKKGSCSRCHGAWSWDCSSCNREGENAPGWSKPMKVPLSGKLPLSGKCVSSVLPLSGHFAPQRSSRELLSAAQR
ncbi:hypothetical protein VIGAN_UM018200 [Vigna angularis var. angularis]|uniref:Uncharacterized protein n=1 Tax=Vigna angularis var. angularis TaxID=157739 RepID=A0A0S3TDK0_PHAAN|nr:hypothetical protein VIGAN_UM018200 [Vigna angularis var. angularis]